MTQAISPEIVVRTMFSEDARPEISGQFSMIGCVPGGIDVAEFPCVLPKLAMVIDYQQRSDLDVLPVTIRAFMPGAGENDPFYEHVHTVESLEQIVAPEVIAGAEDGPFPAPHVKRIIQVAVLRNLEIAKAGVLRVRAFRGDEVFAAGALAIVQTEPAKT